MTAWVPDMICKFYLVKSHTIANNLATNEARERKTSTNLESWQFRTFFGVYWRNSSFTHQSNFALGYCVFLKKQKRFAHMNVLSWCKIGLWNLICKWTLNLKTITLMRDNQAIKWAIEHHWLVALHLSFLARVTWLGNFLHIGFFWSSWIFWKDGDILGYLWLKQIYNIFM